MEGNEMEVLHNRFKQIFFSFKLFTAICVAIRTFYIQRLTGNCCGNLLKIIDNFITKINKNQKIIFRLSHRKHYLQNTAIINGNDMKFTEIHGCYYEAIIIVTEQLYVLLLDKT